MGTSLLRLLYSSKPADAFLLVWTLPDKKSHWFTDLDRADAYCEHCVHQDVYFGLGLRGANLGDFKRGKVADVVGIPGLWVDVDVKGEGHKKQNLPATQEEALAYFTQVLAPTHNPAHQWGELDLSPSAVIATGGGVHFYWRFPQVWVFADPEERQLAKWLTDAWVRYLRVAVATMGWDLDGVADLTRVLRVPDTFNHKYDPPRQVETLQLAEDRVLDREVIIAFLREFDDHLAAQTRSGKGARAVDGAQVEQVGAGLVVRPDAEPPFAKWELLKEMEPRAEDSWNRKRRDLQDQSPSAYDLSLATYAAMAGWSEQEICDLLVAHRVKHRDDLKRPDYYARTIVKARSSARKAEAQDFLDDVQVMEEQGEITAEEKRTRVLQSLSELFCIHLLRIVKYLSDPPQYRLETDRGAIMLGGVQNLITHPALRNAIAAATGVYIPAFKNRWDGIAQCLLDACEEEDVGSEATDIGAVQAWLTEYLDERKAVEDEAEAFAQRCPHLREGSVYIFLGDLQQWLSLHRMEKMTTKQLGAMFKVFGASSEVVAFRKADGTRTTRNLWRLPDGWAQTQQPNDAKE